MNKFKCQLEFNKGSCCLYELAILVTLAVHSCLKLIHAIDITSAQDQV